MQNTGSFRLIVRRGPQPNQVYELAKDSISLGRDITNDIVINDPEVSRHHGKITRTVNGYTLEDLGSTNGTFINGQRLTGSRPLAGGEMIGLGETVTLSYDVSAGSAAPVTYSSAAPQPPFTTAPPPYVPPQSPIPGVDPQPQSVPTYSPYAPPASNQPPPSQAPSYAQQPPMTAPVTSAPPLNPPGQPTTFNGPQYSSTPPAANNYQNPINNVNNLPAGSPYPPLPDTGNGGNNSLRWVLIGCGVLILLCVVFTVAAAFYIDANNLYCKLPVVRQIVGLISSQCVVGQ